MTIAANSLMAGKKGVIMGVANERSLAWHIASSCKAQGAEMILTYPNEAMGARVEPLADKLGAKSLKCDVTSNEAIESTFNNVQEIFGEIDFVVHAVAFSDKNELRGRYLDTSLENFTNTMHVSCYSLTAVSKYAEPIMKDEGSILTLTYYGAEKVVSNYNVMGVAKAGLEASVKYLAKDLGENKHIRINAISAGPVRTLASAGIGDFAQMLKATESAAPMKRNISGEDVGNAALYLLSDLSKNVTAEVLHVDSGINAMFMSN